MQGRFEVFLNAHLSRTLLCLVVLLLVVTVAQGQILTGQITGSVADPSGAVIPGASARAVDIATNNEYTATTDSNREFVIDQLPFRFYRLTPQAKALPTPPRAPLHANLSPASHANASPKP